MNKITLCGQSVRKYFMRVLLFCLVGNPFLPYLPPETHIYTRLLLNVPVRVSFVSASVCLSAIFHPLSALPTQGPISCSTPPVHLSLPLMKTGHRETGYSPERFLMNRHNSSGQCPQTAIPCG